MNRERAETVALQALAFLAAEPERIERFLRISGLEAATLRLRAGEPETLAAALDYLLADDSLAKQFCCEAGATSRDLLTAQHVLACL
jgi:hypothetical protein